MSTGEVQSEVLGVVGVGVDSVCVVVEAVDRVVSVGVDGLVVAWVDEVTSMMHSIINISLTQTLAIVDA